MSNNVGDTQVVEFIHPDSIGVTVWEVEQLRYATGKYAKEGGTYWARITPGIEPFTDVVAVKDFLKAIDMDQSAVWIKR